MVWKKKISAGTQLHYNTTNVVDWSSIQCFPEGYVTNIFKQCKKHCSILMTIFSRRKYPSSFRIIISFISIFGYCQRQKAPKANQKGKFGKASCPSYWIRKVQAFTRCSSTNSFLCFSSHFRNRQPSHRYIPTWFDRWGCWAVVWKGSSSHHRHYKELCCSQQGGGFEGWATKGRYRQTNRQLAERQRKSYSALERTTMHWLVWPKRRWHWKPWSSRYGATHIKSIVR